MTKGDMDVFGLQIVMFRARKNADFQAIKNMQQNFQEE